MSTPEATERAMPLISDGLRRARHRDPGAITTAFADRTRRPLVRGDGEMERVLAAATFRTVTRMASGSALIDNVGLAKSRPAVATGPPAGSDWMSVKGPFTDSESVKGPFTDFGEAAELPVVRVPV
ncbi:hypothetical protein [Amycolatopsis panacis]|uniref:Uncharacterized protein n=1 Tax=Amycolatopsis panacis TaxID=2340917 RepID=A0A419IBD8_9PSEU|nr:hypothetical protein [Amycolatopsis panacis]RJQ91266.1 hypothetical protein D5S19_02025 [Amycolatopsis panacis]